MEGDPRERRVSRCPSSPTAGYGDLRGLTGIGGDDPGDLDAAWQQALSRPWPNQGRPGVRGLSSSSEVVPGLVEVEVAVPRLSPAGW